MIRSDDIRDRLRDIDDYLLNKYKESKKIEKRDWRTYEQQLMKRVILNLDFRSTRGGLDGKWDKKGMIGLEQR